MQHIISFPHLGEVYIIAKALFETVGCEVLVPPYNNKKSLQNGVINSPPDVCIPFKTTLGNFIDALDSGANALFIIGGSVRGICRLPQYAKNHEKILRDLGYEFKMYSSGNYYDIQKTIRKDLREICGNPPDYYSRLIKAIRLVFRKKGLIDLINNLTRYYRAYEIKLGQTSKVRVQMIKMVDVYKTLKELKGIEETINKSFGNIEIDKEKEIVKIGIGGEFFVLCDYFTNCDIERRLAELGVLVENPTNWDYLIKANWGTRKRMIKLGLKYVPISSGGEDLPTIGKVEYFAKKGLDGYISLAPMGCLVETSILPIVHHLSKKFNLPTIHFSIDENLSETYLQTRIEAFTNTIKRKRGII